ncbi:hypothetical protein ECE26_17640, partial [Acinetobacter baumannii]|nr:hypothetical protein [Acinetobacter baumannii]
NLIFDEGKLIGCIDVGRVGIADRYQDLAILWNCLGEFSPSLQYCKCSSRSFSPSFKR